MEGEGEVSRKERERERESRVKGNERSVRGRAKGRYGKLWGD